MDEDLRARLRRLSETIGTDREGPAFPWREWMGYVVLHLALGPIFGLKSLRNVLRRCRSPREILISILGIVPPPRPTPRFLIIAASVGEIRVADRIVRTLTQERGVECVILTRQDSAFATGWGGVHVARLPYNSPLAVPIFLLRWRPRAIVTIEFNDYHHLKAIGRLMGIRQIVVNVPITEEETLRVLRKPSALWRWHLIDAYLTSHEAASERLARLGLPPERTVTTGPLGFFPALGAGLDRGALGLAPDDGPVILAGSTYDDADEPAILAAFDQLLTSHPRAVLILAPRHLGRGSGVDAAMRGRTFALRSEKRALGEARVLLLDTYGELKEAYASADLAIVGGTYGIDHGGHTPVEAIAWGVPTLVGPNHRQHVHTVEWLTEAGAAFVFRTPEELAELMIRLSEDEEAHRRAREAAQRLADEREDPTLPVYDALIAPAM